MSNSVYRRCGCRDEHGKQLGAACPELKSDSRHGSWSYFLSHGSDPRTGKRRQHRKAGFATKRAAQVALAELRTALDRGTYVPPSTMLLADYARQWLARRQVTGSGLKPTTAAGYRRYVEADIVPSRLGDMRVTDVRRAHVNAFVAELTAAGRGSVTVRRITTLLGTIFASAQKDELINANPVSGADRPVLKDSTVRVWEPDDVREFLQRCAQHRLGIVFEVAVLTGLRRGELCGLKWADIDLAARTITVRRTRVSVRGQVHEQTTTKTRAGLRTVLLSDMAVASLLTWQLRQAEEAESAAEAWRTEGHVFTMEDGRPLDPSYITRLFQMIRKQGESLPSLSFHGLRHVAASLLLASGADIAVVSKLLGHASIAVTSDVYGHLVGTIAQKAVDGAANLIAHTVHTQQGRRSDADFNLGSQRTAD
jgi:integrase